MRIGSTSSSATSLSITPEAATMPKPFTGLCAPVIGRERRGRKGSRGIAQRVLGQLTHVRGQYNRARELLETSRRTLADIGYAAELARTEAALAALAAERSAATESIADTQ